MPIQLTPEQEAERAVPDVFPRLEWTDRGSTTLFGICEGLRWRKDGRWTIPDFQRPLVWSTDQKVAFVESLILGLPVGSYCIHRRNSDSTIYEVLDGQQRWSAIFGYVDNEFPVFGHYWNDLPYRSRRRVEDCQFPCRFVQGLTREQKIDAYNRLAYGGTAHAKGG